MILTCVYSRILARGDLASESDLSDSAVMLLPEQLLKDFLTSCLSSTAHALDDSRMAFVYLLPYSQLLANTHEFLLALTRHWTCPFLYLFSWLLVFFSPSTFLVFFFQYFFSSCQHLLFFLQCPVLPSSSLSSITFPLEGLFNTSDVITSGFTYMPNVKYVWQVLKNVSLSCPFFICSWCFQRQYCFKSL